jgi:hypothetical protein
VISARASQTDRAQTGIIPALTAGFDTLARILPVPSDATRDVQTHDPSGDAE